MLGVGVCVVYTNASLGILAACAAVHRLVTVGEVSTAENDTFAKAIARPKWRKSAFIFTF